jgi:hypothetical protein
VAGLTHASQVAGQALAAVAQQIEPAGPAPAPGMASPNPAGRRGKEQADDDPPVSDGSTSQARIIRRIKRDHPDIAERLERGEFRSARAAGEIEVAVKGRDPEAWREIEERLAQWEAKHRTHGGDRSNGGDTPDGPRDHKSARGIRRRLVKRAQAGDTQAAALVEQLKAGLPVNQAAIAAGMRQEYMRVRKDDAVRACQRLRP